MRTLIRIIAAVATLPGMAEVRAHHNGYACLARGTSLTIEGDLEEYQFTMPHVVLKIRLADGVLYTAEWMTSQQLAGRGLNRDTLQVGDHLVVRGTPYACEKDMMSLLATVRRPADGWEWISPIYK